jgi:alanyl-tRNA synthetase
MLASQKTVLEYFKSSLIFSIQSHVLLVQMKENEIPAILVLDRTIFHAKGGGQSTDIGTISSSTSLFTVISAELDRESGQVLHHGHFRDCNQFSVGEQVDLEIDSKNRMQNAKMHSAGHLIDVGVRLLRPDLVPTKGNHSLGNCFVEFRGTIEDKIEFVEKLQNVLNRLIKEDLPVDIDLANPEKRLIRFGDFEACPCGGTHVTSSGDLRGLIIEKVQKQKDCVKIKYTLN